MSTNHDVRNIANTPVKANVLEIYLADYPFAEIARELFSGFSSGFSLHYYGPRIQMTCSNVQSLIGNENIALDIALKEVQLGRVAGPFPCIPLPNLRISPVGLVPKKDGSWRLIHHLSYPENASVNDFIDEKYCSVRYSSFDTALEMLAMLGQGAIAARLDIKSAFRLLPIDPKDFELLGFKISNYYFVDKCLPFGCSLSCNLFEKFATFLEWELKRRSNSENVVHYLDDFLVAGAAHSNDCAYLMSEFKGMCEQFGVPMAEEKTIGPTSVLTFLGLEINTNHMTVSIPQDKLQRLYDELSSLLTCKKTTLKTLQSVTGLLNFCCRAIPAGRAFIRRFYDAMTGLSKPHHHVRVNVEMKKDIKTWLMFLDKFNGTNLYKYPKWFSAQDLQFFTDSAGGAHLGCAAIFKTHWSFLTWPHVWYDEALLKDISFLELVPIVMAFHLWGDKLKNQSVILNTDNQALVSILNKRSSKSKRVMHLVRPLVLYCLLHNIHYRAVHVVGKSNLIADALSRQDWGKFHHYFPHKDANPTPIPHSFLKLLSGIEVMTS